MPHCSSFVFRETSKAQYIPFQPRTITPEYEIKKRQIGHTQVKSNVLLGEEFSFSKVHIFLYLAVISLYNCLVTVRFATLLI